jgi:hypothetical protein
MAILTVQQALSPLVGLPLRAIGRATNMLWLQFGEMREVPARGGGTKNVGDWALHIQCPWRLCRPGQIVVGYHDFYYDLTGKPLDDWDKPGHSRFDHAAAALRRQFETSPPLVDSATPDDVGGFTLRLSPDYQIDVFPTSGDDSTEHWRVFRPGDLDSHFVFREPLED